MTKLFLLAIITLISMHYALSQKEVPSNIEKVTVYLNGAQITRVAKVELNAGKNILLFKGLPSVLNKKNLQAMATGGDDVLLLGVTTTLNYINRQQNSPEIIALEKKRNQLKDTTLRNQKMIDVLVEEKSMILDNKSIKGNNNGVVLNDLKQIADFFKDRLTSIELKILSYQKKQKMLKNILQDIDKQLKLYTTQQPTNEVEVILNSKKKINTQITLQYIVSDVAWSPTYDIRIHNISDPLQLIYKAQVQQNTGEDWNNVLLTFSTANPTISNVQPALNPEYVNFNSPRPLLDQASYMKVNQEVSHERLANYQIASVNPNNENEINMSIKVDIPYSIPSNNKIYDISMIQYKIPTTYKYSCIPKLADYAYLIANIPNSSDYRLLKGEANIFFKNMFYGNTHLNNSISDTMHLSVGRDNEIIIERKELKNFNDKKLIGSTQSQQKVYEITIRNNKKIDINITVEDQYPISQKGDIKVFDLHIPNATEDNTTGKIIWNLQLKPNTTQTIQWGYTLKFPKDKTIIIR
ncbi:MAG: DUF4139 domain-containing protein [Chitinophagaceae bacterium]